MKLLIRILVTSVLVMLLAYFMKGVTVAGFEAALIVSIVLGLLNVFVKPVLVFFTLPATLFTLGLFLLVINATIILLCDNLVSGFRVESFWTALLFSIVLSISESIVFKLTESKEQITLKFNILKACLGCKNFIFLQPNFN